VFYTAFNLIINHINVIVFDSDDIGELRTTYDVFFDISQFVFVMGTVPVYIRFGSNDYLRVSLYHGLRVYIEISFSIAENILAASKFDLLLMPGTVTSTVIRFSIFEVY